MSFYTEFFDVLFSFLSILFSCMSRPRLEGIDNVLLCIDMGDFSLIGKYSFLKVDDWAVLSKSLYIKLFPLFRGVIYEVSILHATSK